MVFENYSISGNWVTLKYNSNVYPLRAIYLAAFSFLDECYIMLDGDESQYFVHIRPKQQPEVSLKELNKSHGDKQVIQSAKKSSALNSTSQTVEKDRLQENNNNKSYLDSLKDLALKFNNEVIRDLVYVNEYNEYRREKLLLLSKLLDQF